jgi:hypothetical protein
LSVPPPLPYALFIYLFIINKAPAYLQLLPPSSPPTTDVIAFLDLLARRLGMLKRGGGRDISRAGAWFVKWWREEGGLASAVASDAAAASVVTTDGGVVVARGGWGFDFEWLAANHPGESVSVQQRMEECIDSYLVSAKEEERDGNDVSSTQSKHKVMQEKVAKRKAKQGRVRASRR